MVRRRTHRITPGNEQETEGTTKIQASALPTEASREEFPDEPETAASGCSRFFWRRSRRVLPTADAISSNESSLPIVKNQDHDAPLPITQPRSSMFERIRLRISRGLTSLRDRTRTRADPSRTRKEVSVPAVAQPSSISVRVNLDSILEDAEETVASTEQPVSITRTGQADEEMKEDLPEVPDPTVPRSGDRVNFAIEDEVHSLSDSAESSEEDVE